MKKIIKVLLATFALAVVLVGCGGGGATEETGGTDEAGGAMDGPITVVSREAGSGTRGAFVELTGVEEDDNDNTTADAAIQNSTNAVMTTVAGDPASLGYISLGSLNDTVKAIKIDGVDISAATVADKTYPIARPFNIVTGETVDPVAEDFIKYILSDDGQAIVEAEGYIKVDSTGAYAAPATPVSGSVTVGGSSSVTPVMEKLAEGYKAVNPDANIQVSQSDSTTGVQNAIDGVVQIGMASRELKEDEAAQLTGTPIAMDGIAVIVNKDNAIADMTMDNVKGIYTGEIMNWEDIK